MSCFHKRIWACALLALLMGNAHVLSATLEPATSPWRIGYSDTELQEVYESLSPAQRRTLDDMALPDREALLGRYAQRLRPKMPSMPQRTYELEPLLVDAIQQLPNRTMGREDIIALFERYLHQHPDSPFRAEVYFRMGARYTMHTSLKLGERPDLQKALPYFQKAHELYGNKFSVYHNAAWASIANKAGTPLVERKRYYDWLLKLQESGTEEDLYDVPEILELFANRPHESEELRRQRLMGNMTALLPSYIASAEKNTLGRAQNNYAALLDLARSYPNTEMGKEATRMLNVLDRTQVGSVFDDPSFLVPHETPPHQNIDVGVVDKPIMSTGATAATGVATTAAPRNVWWPWHMLALATTVCLLGGLLVHRYARRKRATS
jgi:tetratricopeptide (TPR) repeat protein